MAIYMEYNKGSIKGDVTATDHKQWIEITSFSWGIGRSVMGGVGSMANREADRPSVSEITVSKTMDASSPLLCQEDITNTKGVDVKIEFVRTGNNNKAETYLKFTLSNTVLSSYSISSGGDRPTESLALNFTKFEYDYSGLKTDGTPGDPNKFIYDMAAAT
jgi:type VI secretion system secreted protein Hcp